MTMPAINRTILRMHVAAIEGLYPIKIVGLLPEGSAGPVPGAGVLNLLAEKRNGLSLLGLASAEVELGDRMGRPVGIVLTSGLCASEAVSFPKVVEPI